MGLAIRPIGRYCVAALTAACLLFASCDAVAVIPVAATGSNAVAATPAPTPEPEWTPAPLPVKTGTPEPTPAETSAPTPAPTPEPTPTPQPPPAELSLLFAGDITFHEQTLKYQWDGTRKEYDFTSLFENVAPVIQKADFAVGNLESPVWDTARSKLDAARFAVPDGAIDSLKQAGFDVLCTANDHAADQGLPALANTIEALKSRGLLAAGTYRDQAEMDSICMLEKNGVKVALLTYAKNARQSWRNTQGMGVQIIGVDRMLSDMKRARDTGADAVIFFLHFGTEYSHKPDANQKNVVRALQAAGADAVIGCHPRVLQPLSFGAGGFVAAYSLGNALTYLPSKDRQYSAFLQLTVEKDPSTGKASVNNVSWVPTWVRTVGAPGEKARVRVFDLRRALAACESGTDPMLPAKYLNELKTGMRIAKDLLGENYMEPMPIADP